MVVQDRDCLKDRVSVPGEVRKLHKAGKPIRTKRRLALAAFLGLSAFWLAQSLDGLGRFADRLTPLSTALKDARASFEHALSGLLNAEGDSQMAPLADESSGKEKLFDDRIVGVGTDAKARLSIDDAFQGLQDAVNGFWQGALSRADRAVGDYPEHSGSIRQDALVKGAILGTLVLIGLGFGSGLLAVFTRSVRQLDESIRRLGAGDFGRPIRVTGPRNLRYLGDRLEWLRARLLGREESKKQFISKVSSQFETPLSGIFESTGLLMAETAGGLTPKQRDLMARLRQDVQKLQSLVDESLHYNQVKDNPSPQPKRAVNMKTLLASVIEDHQDALKAKSLTIKELVQPVEFVGVPDQIRTIIENLLSNAIKFSPEGGTIRIILRDLGTGIELEVEDDGPGIDAAERPRIFEPFFRGKTAHTTDTEGAGLGLAIVSECVANHQGKVESIEPRQDEKGARIRVELPLVEAPSE
jgi:two-component system sensor histidine kinase GlrK